MADNNREKSIIIQGQLKSIIESGAPVATWEPRLQDALNLYFKAMTWTREDIQDACDERS
jgi:hypothetical protein